MASLRPIRWIARVLSIASSGVLLLFVVGEGIDPARVAPQEWVGLLFFPFGVIAGMAVAWWREGIGGGLTVVSLLAFLGVYGYLMVGRVPQPLPFLAFASPGFLFVLCWLLSRRTAGERG